jgi:SHAQKYF class myb-like DNA-binding protein
MSKIYEKKQNNSLISKKKPFTINYMLQTTFSYNMNQNNYLMKKTQEKAKLISSKNKETCFSSLNHNKENKEGQKEIKKDLKIKFKVNQETELIKKIFITKRIQKNSERWNKKEKILFLEGLYRFGCDWKSIKKYIKSRSPIQVRSHAQKFLLRLRKFKDDSLGIDFTKDSYNNAREIIQKLKEIIDNSKNENIFHILIEKLSRKKVKNGKTESFNYNKLTNISDSIYKKNIFNINIFNEDNNNNKNVKETNDNNNIKKDINISEMNLEMNKKYERNTIIKDYDINHYYGINFMIPNTICLNDGNYFENNKVNSYDDIALSEEKENNGIIKLFDAFEKEEIKYYWHFNEKINLFDNQIPENIEKAFEKFT